MGIHVHVVISYLGLGPNNPNYTGSEFGLTSRMQDTFLYSCLMNQLIPMTLLLHWIRQRIIKVVGVYLLKIIG